MKILVAIANYGTKNDRYLDCVLREYRAMPDDVHVVVLSNVSKNFGEGVEVVLKSPKGDPWSFPFAHKRIFAERALDYELFIYSEDDTLITRRNIEAFRKATDVLPER